MDNIIKQLKKGAKHTRLSLSEKTEMKSALLRHVKMNPIRAEDTLRALATSNGAGPVRNEMFARQQFVKANKSILPPFQINNLRNRKTMPILVILGLLMGGSASFAAENTVPGDILYPVKVHVNEPVRGTFAVTPKAKAEWEVHLVERRLEEVEKLATTPSALPEAQQIAQTNLAEYANRVKERIAKFEGDNDSEDAILTAGELADMLRTHEEVLAGLSTQVAGAAATSTEATTATTTANITTSTSTTPVSTVPDNNTQSFESILAQLHADRNEAEKKHKELKHKYHPEIQKAEEDKKDQGNDEGEEVVSSQWAPMPVKDTTVGTSTATIQTIVPEVSSWKHGDTSDRKEHNEEIRATAEGAVFVASTTAPVVSVPTMTTEHTEIHTETQKASESAKSNDND